MNCTTGKRIFYSKELAEEALIANHQRFHHREGQGPINVYECHECGNWHFTSKGDINDLLKDPAIKSEINQQRQAMDWEKRFKKR